MARPGRSAAVRVRSEALLLRRVPYGEADLVVTLLTEARGVVSAVARSARRSSRRFGALEPMHLLIASFDERPLSELGTLVETAILRPRLHLTSELERLEAAGRALRWVRRASPPNTPEPGVWRELNALLDALDERGDRVGPAARLAGAGLRLLIVIGWGLDLERCVRCGARCSERASACVDPAQGGLVCRACGGARTILSADRRRRLLAAAAGRDDALEPGDDAVALELVDSALAAHAGLAA